MPTIKRKVEMNLPQLIEWCWENDVKNERYRCSDTIPYEYVWINENYDVELDDDMRISKNDTFTVEFEEEITGDTVLPESLVVFEHNGNLYTERHNSKCISKLLCLDKKVKGSDTKTIYILNEGGTLTLIWTKEERLVE